ncbi:MAG TPA: phosphoenolpyruvate carboxykinase domain-containing protein [Polyangiaceae bacterium]|nr:phosphoenolpyruvate carboxykinase domain-containing protein [Polyangiaceae bacterium]
MDPGRERTAAHPYARFTAAARNCPLVGAGFEDPTGVPISAILFGSRHARLAPLVYETRTWAHGVYVGATLVCESVAAAGTAGAGRNDPMAMRPYCGFNMADYFAHWLSMGKRLEQPPGRLHSRPRGRLGRHPFDGTRTRACGSLRVAATRSSTRKAQSLMHRQFSIRSCGVLFAIILGSALAACGSAASESEGPNVSGEAVHPLLGKPGPDFAEKTVTGNRMLALHDLSGKIAVVDFWATWCEPCKKSFPKLEALNAKYGADGVQVVGVSEDDDNSGIRDFAANLGAKFPLVWDENKTIASRWQPKAMPSTFILDRSGKIRFVHLGYHDNEEAVLEREIKSLL